MNAWVLLILLASGKSGPMPSAAAPAPVKAGVESATSNFKNPVEVNADHLEILGKKNQAVWVGHVKAHRGTTDLQCERLIAYYTSTQEITKLECLGHVEVTDGDKWAKGDRADFDNLTGVLDVTGSPEARQGRNHMKGSKVTFFVGTDVVEVKDAVTVFESSAQGTPPLPKSGSGKREGPAKKKGSP